MTGVGALAVLLRGLPAMAGPFETADFQSLVPEDKKLSPEWGKALFERGEPTVYRGADLKYIGMPIGGITTGQLYLGGDGKLWHWDIFNQIFHTGADHYAHPVEPKSPLEQGFSLCIGSGDRAKWRALDAKGFTDVSFMGQYPIGTVEYRDADCPVEVTLEAFSPFVPLNADDSSLPLTILQFTLKNTSAHHVDAQLAGHLQNAVGLYSDADHPYVRKNEVSRGNARLLMLTCSADAPASASTQPARETIDFEDDEPDFGTMTLALLDPTDADRGIADGVVLLDGPNGTVSELKLSDSAPPASKTIGALVRKLSLDPGASHTARFVVAWCFPNQKLERVHGGVGQYYATRFKSSAAAAEYVAENFDRLTSTTRLWRDTFYDSTLPYRFLDRTHQNISILATSTAHRFANGRFYGWEGVGCCEGTCTHVWQYEQGMGRLFPELDKLLRQWADFNPKIGMKPDGMIDHRGEFHAGEAVDGQAGTILRAYRDHQMSADDAFLRENYPSIKKAMQWLIAQDGLDGVKDGILRGPQHNTLDAEWYGPVAWLSGLYLASLRAAEEMAGEAGDPEFAAHCRKIFEIGRKTFVELLFDGEYFMNIPDPKRPDAINSGSGCEIDQVMGQSWAFQVGLGRVIPEKETRAALHSIWKYNFSPDVGLYRKVNKPGRWYAMPGEAGLLMCTFPRADWNYRKASGKGPEWAAGYFDECMNGFEHEVAGHMIWEGLLLEGLAVERAIHDRYHASRRNPWNEVECGDHYARSMASYGLFIAACGFEYHGPRGHLAFSPRLTPENFKAAFTSAEGWGVFSQQSDQVTQKVQLTIKWGKLRLNTLRLTLPKALQPQKVIVALNGKPVEAQHAVADGKVTITFPGGATIARDQLLEAALS